MWAKNCERMARTPFVQRHKSLYALAEEDSKTQYDYNNERLAEH